MVFNSRSVKKFQKNAANVAKFHKKFPIRSELSKSLIDVTNLKTITYFEP